MEQLTVRGFDPELEHRLRAIAKNEGLSLSQAAIRLMRRGAGIDAPQAEPNTIGHTLDHLFGTWSDEEAAAFERALAGVDPIDHELWR